MTWKPSATRLRELSEEVNRVASLLARVSNDVAELPSSPETVRPSTPDLPAVEMSMIRNIIRARKLRAAYFPADLFADPAWDILLNLLAAEITQHRVTVSSLCAAAAVPPTTALRWIKLLTDRRLVTRREDPHDGRRIFIELAPATSETLGRYFEQAGKLVI